MSKWLEICIVVYWGYMGATVILVEIMVHFCYMFI
jgi:hypothetical protein